MNMRVEIMVRPAINVNDTIETEKMYGIDNSKVIWEILGLKLKNNDLPKATLRRIGEVIYLTHGFQVFAILEGKYIELNWHIMSEILDDIHEIQNEIVNGKYREKYTQ